MCHGSSLGTRRWHSSSTSISWILIRNLKMEKAEALRKFWLHGDVSTRKFLTTADLKLIKGKKLSTSSSQSLEPQRQGNFTLETCHPAAVTQQSNSSPAIENERCHQENESRRWEVRRWRGGGRKREVNKRKRGTRDKEEERKTWAMAYNPRQFSFNSFLSLWWE